MVNGKFRFAGFIIYKKYSRTFYILPFDVDYQVFAIGCIDISQRSFVLSHIPLHVLNQQYIQLAVALKSQRAD